LVEAVTTNSDPLLGGFYTVSEAARLLRIARRQRIARWLDDDNDTPLIVRDYPGVGRHQELSFWDLIEVRFVEHFRKQGFSLQFLRKAARKARNDLSTRHPFALSNTRFLTERKRIFRQTLDEEGHGLVSDLMSGQFEMYEIIEEALSRGVAFDPNTGLASEWTPNPHYPDVIVNPRFAYGQPVVGAKRIPTSALWKQLRAEGGDIARVARWFGVASSDVTHAAEFEASLGA